MDVHLKYVLVVKSITYVMTNSDLNPRDIASYNFGVTTQLP